MPRISLGWPCFLVYDRLRGIRRQVSLVEELMPVKQSLEADAIAREAISALSAEESALAVNGSPVMICFLFGPGDQATLIKCIDIAMSTVEGLAIYGKDHC
jgi:hypothetical protein